MEGKRRILLVQPDTVLARTLVEHLCDAGYEMAEGEASAWDLALVDDLAEGGADLVGRLRAVRPSRPVVGLGAGLAGCADMVVAKPLRLGHLVVRIRDALTRAALPELGSWTFDAVGRVLRGRDGTQVRLTDKESAILAALLAAGGPVPREKLLADIWGYGEAISTHTLETHVYRLRRKLGQGAPLVTEAGGYRLKV